MKNKELTGLSELRVSAQKLGFINTALKHLGVPQDTDLTHLLNHLDDQEEHKQTVPIKEVVQLYQRISKIEFDGIGLEIGKQISCGDYGLYGCTLLCKSHLEDSLHYSIKYHTLVTRTSRLYLDGLKDGHKLYGCTDILFQPEIKDFNLEFQIGINLTLIREVLGDSQFAPNVVLFEANKPSYSDKIEAFTKCEVRYNQPVTGLELNKSALKLPLVKSNPLALPLLLKIADEHKPNFAHQSEVVERVYNWVSQNIHNELKIERIADELCVSERTLRRKLSDNGTSFTAICLSIKQGFAKKYIRETQLSFDDIAESLGFKDTSNFRHAFKEWTGMTPTEFRNVD